MAIPRPVLLAMVGLVAVIGAFLVTRNVQSGDEGGSTVVAEPDASKAAPKPAKSRSSDRPSKPPTKRPPAPNAGPGSPARQPAKDARLPKDVARALDERDVIVLLFTQRGAADDEATRDAVGGLDEDPERVTVKVDRIGNLARYREVVGGLGVSQAPSLVIVGRDTRARLLEGFTDPGTLEQLVADELR
jgi:hypothetical protein